MPGNEVTSLLQRASHGDTTAVAELLPLVYQELRSVAERYMLRERRDHTLQSTALVHETYLRLVGSQEVHWQGRAHFVGVAARAMRQILVEHARARATARRGAAWTRRPLDDMVDLYESRTGDLLALDAALQKLSHIDETQGRLIELRFFGGMTMEQAAEALGCPLRSAEREWNMARAWLRRELGASDAEGGAA
jgi:RNA polymerase sigma factor (TIGR02999 family)